ncbi:MAG: MOSC domain-containing protein [Acidobacteria bacterium]|nr:MOSC domain-containing protein [Acidobacteriota bacterium]MBI3425887.1 MOSC domain-containing protein [Acidobacteriota bacterium]
MNHLIGTVQALYRYPVKSMAGEALQTATLGWHGMEGDRRFAFRRVAETGGFPWLSAGRLPALIRYQPYASSAGSSPTHVRTPDGRELELHGAALCDELAALHGAELQLMHLKHGMFDEAPLALITTETLGTLSTKAGTVLDVRRFRPNILLATNLAIGSGAPFPENDWIGKLIVFGETDDAAAMNVTQRDVRCAMVNLDPETGVATPGILKAVVQANENCAGVYGGVFRTGKISLGDRVFVVDV